jgi:hypothetical protein
MRPTILLLLHVFFAAGRRLPNRYVAKKEILHFTEPLLSNNGRDTQADAQTGAKDDKGNKQTHREDGDRINRLCKGS